MLRKLLTGLMLASLLACNVAPGASYASHPSQVSRGQGHPRPVYRSSAARRAFMRDSGYPNGRPGYVVDHVVPLCAGGADDPSNMQWQEVGQAKEKDKWEGELCRNLRQ